MTSAQETKVSDKRKSHKKHFACFSLIILGICSLLCVAPTGLFLFEDFWARIDHGQCARAIKEQDLGRKFEQIPVYHFSVPLLSIDPNTASRIVELKRLGHGYIQEVFWSQDDDLLVLTSVGLWKHFHDNLENEPELLWSYSTGVVRFALSPDNRFLAVKTASHPATIPIWDVNTGKELIVLEAEGGSGPLEAMAFSPDGKLFAAAVGDDIHVWDVQSGKKRHVLTGFTGLLDSVAFSPNNRILAAGGSDMFADKQIDFVGTIRLWDTTSGEVMTIMRLDEASHVDSLAFSPDGTVLASGGEQFLGHHVRLWNVSSGKQIKVVKVPSAAENMMFSPDGLLLAHGGRVYRMDDFRLMQDYGERNRVVFNLDGQLTATAPFYNYNNPDSTIIVRLRTGIEKIATISTYNQQYTNWYIEFTGDQQLQASSSYQNYSINPSQTRLALAENRGSSDAVIYIKLCHLASKGQLADFRADIPATFSPDGAMLATVGECGSIDFRNADTGDIIRNVSECSHGLWTQVTSIAFSPNGTLLAVARKEEADSYIELWDSQKNLKLTTLHEPAYRVSQVAFSPDGTLMAYASGDQTIRFWGVPSAK